MSRTYVALDLETTGLDADRDAIMEIGAVRFDLDGHAETFSTFVDPERPVPYRIPRLPNPRQGVRVDPIRRPCSAFPFVDQCTSSSRGA